MDANVTELLASLQSTGFRDIAGSQASVRIPISRSLVNRLVAQVLQGASTAVRDVDVRPQAGDRFDLVISLSWPLLPPLEVAVTVAQQPQLPASPVLVFRWSLFGAVGTLASRLIASIHRLPDGIRLEGNNLTLDVFLLAERGPAAPLLPFVKALELHTIDDRIVIDVELKIPDA